MIEATKIGTVLSAAQSRSDVCDQCGRRRRHAERKWCRPCILSWQRALPADEVKKRRGTVTDTCPDWKDIMPERFWAADMSHLPAELVKRIEALPDDRGLFLWGSQGAGKTFAAAAAVKRLWAGGYDIAWQPFEELLLRVRDTYRGDGGSEWSIIEPLCKADVLVLDDVGVTVSADRQESDFSLRTFLVLLDHRLTHCRRTFVTSNRAIEDMGRSFDARIASRLCEACEVVKICGADRRVMRAKESRGLASD